MKPVKYERNLKNVMGFNNGIIEKLKNKIFTIPSLPRWWTSAIDWNGKVIFPNICHQLLEIAIDNFPGAVVDNNFISITSLQSLFSSHQKYSAWKRDIIQENRGKTCASHPNFFWSSPRGLPPFVHGDCQWLFKNYGNFIWSHEPTWCNVPVCTLIYI